MTNQPAQRNSRSRLDGRAVMRQRWRELAFLHWEWEPAAIARLLPPGLAPDLHHGRAFIGAIPFRMEGVRPLGVPPLPWLSAFPEFNLRTYVRDRHGRPGVWFFSLDAGNPLAVWLARTLYHLPYHRASMSCQRDRSLVRHWSHRHAAPHADRIHCRPAGNPASCPPGSLDAFLIERYRFFSYDPRGQRLFMGQVAHAPYRVCPASITRLELAVWENDGLSPPQRPPELVHFSQGVDVAAGLVRPVAA